MEQELTKETQTTDNPIEKMGLHERILRIANELVIGKNGKNTFSGYDYIRPDDLQNSLKPLLLKYRTYTYFNVEHTDLGRNNAILEVGTFDNDEKQCWNMNVEDIVIKGANTVQNSGGIRTYCKRYLIMDAFYISDNADDLDNDRKSEPAQKTGDRAMLLNRARALANAKNKVNSDRTREAVKEFAPSMRIDDIDEDTKLTKLIQKLEEIN